MKTTREEQIIARLGGLGTDPKTGYTQREIIDRLIGLENALLSGIYEKTHVENMHPQDLIKHFSALAEEYSLVDSDAYKRFVTNVNVLDLTVKSFIAGQKGEKLARSSLRPLIYDKGTKILYNVQLGNDELKTEYDAIVITPYGMFMIEVKNWFGDVTLTREGFLVRKSDSISTNLAARMVVKETLLKECLGDLFPANYHNVLLFPEEKTRFIDEYHQIPFSYGASISNSIKFCYAGQMLMTTEQVNEIAARITDHSQKQKVFCSVKCSEIIEDYASLMAQIESPESDEEDGIEITMEATVEVPDIAESVVEKGQSVIRNIPWKRIVGTAAGISVTLVSGFIAGRLFSPKY